MCLCLYLHFTRIRCLTLAQYITYSRCLNKQNHGGRLATGGDTTHHVTSISVTWPTSAAGGPAGAACWCYAMLVVSIHVYTAPRATISCHEMSPASSTGYWRARPEPASARRRPPCSSWRRSKSLSTRCVCSNHSRNLSRMLVYVCPIGAESMGRWGRSPPRPISCGGGAILSDRPHRNLLVLRHFWNSKMYIKNMNLLLCQRQKLRRF